MKSPFKFLDAYDRQDKEIFFGRTDEIDQLYSLVFQTKLLLVYGQSGTGKTSLIQCGLANRFRPTDWFELFVRRKDNLNASLDREIRRQAHTPIAEETSVHEAIQSLYLDHLRPVYLIFDQFEELFILGSKGEQQIFIRTIATLLKSDIACKIIFVMREEYIAMLYEFEKQVPSLFDKRFRVEPMSNANVQRVITGTTAAFDISLEDGDKTAQHIIENLSDHRTGVQLSYLQVYLDKLYREATHEHAGEKHPVVFTEQLVQRTGALGDVMADFLEEQTASIQKELSTQYPTAPATTVQLMLEEFATLEGTKQPVPRNELSEKLTLPDSVIDACLLALEKNRLLRNVEGVYELAHDTLAGRIDDKRSIEEKNRLKVQKLVRDRFSVFAETHTYLNKEELSFSNPYLAKVSLSEQEYSYVKKSESLVKRKQRQTTAAIMGVMLSVIVGLAWWANRQHEISQELQTTLDSLESEKLSVTRAADSVRSEVNEMRTRNKHLRAEIAAARKDRDTLSMMIITLREKNRKIELTIRKLDNENEGLWQRIDTLWKDQNLLKEAKLKLETLSSALSMQADTLGSMNTRILAEMTHVKETYDDLRKKVALIAQEEHLLGSMGPDFLEPYELFKSLHDIRDNDELRKQVEDLEKLLDSLHTAKLMQSDEAGWLKKEKELLERQKHALLEEVHVLGGMEKKLLSRARDLTRVAEEKTDQKRKLTDRLTEKEERLRIQVMRDEVARLRDATEATLQKNFGLRSTIAWQRERIVWYKRENNKYAMFLSEKVNDLTSQVRKGKVSPDLAGLLAVAAFRLAPFNPDDPTNRTIHDALQLALNRLDENAVRELLEPRLSQSIEALPGEVLAREICRRLTRQFTIEEWMYSFPVSGLGMKWRENYDGYRTFPCWDN